MPELPSDELLDRFESAANAAWNRGELDALDEFFADDVAVHDFTLDEEATSYFAADDRLVSQWVFTGTHDGTLPEIEVEPTNQPVELAGVTVYEMTDGVVTEAWWYFDMMGLLSQLGLVPEELPA
jgi:predicted ester cyclase